MFQAALPAAEGGGPVFLKVVPTTAAQHEAKLTEKVGRQSALFLRPQPVQAVPGRPGLAVVGFPWVSGCNLLNWYPQTSGQVFSVAQQLLQAAKVLHGLLIIHGDFKPDNVMLRDDGKLVVINFGIGMSAAGPDVMVTGYGGVEGFMAPERWAFLDDPSSPPYNPFAADWFSVGMVLKHVRGAFYGDATPEVLTVEAVAAQLSSARPEDRPNPTDALKQLATAALSSDTETLSTGSR